MSPMLMPVWTDSEHGLISLEEAIESNSDNNGTKEGLKQVDKDNGGFVGPSEFDNSLVWSKYTESYSQQ